MATSLRTMSGRPFSLGALAAGAPTILVDNPNNRRVVIRDLYMDTGACASVTVSLITGESPSPTVVKVVGNNRVVHMPSLNIRCDTIVSGTGPYVWAVGDGNLCEIGVSGEYYDGEIPDMADRFHVYKEVAANGYTELITTGRDAIITNVWIDAVEGADEVTIGQASDAAGTTFLPSVKVNTGNTYYTESANIYFSGSTDGLYFLARNEDASVVAQVTIAGYYLTAP